MIILYKRLTYSINKKIISLAHLRASCSTEELKDSHEKNYDIDVKSQSTNDVVIQSELISVSTHDKLSVIDQIDTINTDSKNTDNAGDNIVSLRVTPGDENSKYTNGEDTPTEDPKETTAHCEVSLGSAGIDGQSDGEGSSEDSSQNNILERVSSGDESDQVSFTDGEETEEDIVSWDGSSNLSITR